MPCRCDFDVYEPPKNVLKVMHENKSVENLRNELRALGKAYNDLKADDKSDSAALLRLWIHDL